ncbi:MAG: HEPN domain-containing protein [Thermoplasmataceae archaeon]
MDKINNKALENAFRWLNSAELNYAQGNMDIAVYSLEMSFEKGIKSLLQKMCSDFPKSHSVEDFFVISVENNSRIDQETKAKLLSYMENFRTLLRLRNVAGYDFEYQRKLESLGKVYEMAHNSVESFLGYVENAIKELDKTP